MIDRDANVVGLIFEGNIEMLGNRYVFDDQVSRTVSVHPAIIIESLRKIYGAKALADELERFGIPTVKVMGAVARNVKEAAEEARLKTAQANIISIANAVKMYRVKNGKLPETLAVLAQKDDKGRSELEELPADPWGNQYILRVGERPTEWEVVSMGPDGSEGTADDISSMRR
jgi:type II secretion system protein G